MTEIKELLERATVIAVVGCSDNPHRTSYGIADFLIRQGYKVYPVNPTIETALGLRCYPSVQSVPEHVNIVNVFRNPEHAYGVVEDAIAAGADAIWFQLGAEHEGAERRAAEAGLQVISDMCIAVTYRGLGVRRNYEGEKM